MSGQETQPKETAMAYAAFLEYCALGRGRSLTKLAQVLGKSSGYTRYLEEWSSQHKWQERVKRYDQEQIAERVVKKQAKRDEMEDRHAKEAKEEQEIARKLLKAGAEKGRVSIAAVQLLKNSRDDERKALIEEEIPVFEQDNKGAVIGIAIYLPQKQVLKGGDS